MTITATLNAEAVELNLGTQIAREDLHGKTSIIAQKDGQTLEKARLRPNGEILRTGEHKHTDVDPFGTPLEKPVQAQPEGQPAEPKAPVLTPATIDVIPEYQVAAFLSVTTAIPQGIYETTYTSKISKTVSDALLIVKPDEAFMLIGKKRPTIFIDEIPNYDFFAADEANENNTENEGDGLDINF